MKAQLCKKHMKNTLHHRCGPLSQLSPRTTQRPLAIASVHTCRSHIAEHAVPLSEFNNEDCFASERLALKMGGKDEHKN